MDMFAERGTESNRTHVLFLFPHIFVSQLSRVEDPPPEKARK